MKLACSSTAFDRLLQTGDLTQLEWLDLCAHELAADGIVVDLRHFPRSDTDYLAQVKKMAVDLGLTMSAVRSDAFFTSDETAMERAFEIAQALGAPLLCAPMPRETEAAWGDTLQRLSTATALAKRCNVTIALRNAAETFAAGTRDMKRVAKEADSAWLRFGPEIAAFDAASEPASVLDRSVLAWHDIHRGQSAREDARLLENFLGFVVLDAGDGCATAAEMENAVRQWRSGIFEDDRT
jgi:hypothetical protein